MRKTWPWRSQLSRHGWVNSMEDSYRIGHGVDVHKFADTVDKKKPLRLAGIIVSEKHSLLAHSDGDVILHAICDAILGASAKGDIGDHFPDCDPAYRGVDSSNLLKHVLSLVSEINFEIVNMDITVLAETPRLAPFRQEMVDNLCSLIGLDSSRCNLKATTTEGLGYLGRKEGIACHCVILMKKNI